MRAEHEKAIALLRRLDANPEIKTAVVLDVMATFTDIFAMDRRDQAPFIDEFVDSIKRQPLEEES